MSTITNQIGTERIRVGPTLVSSPLPKKIIRPKWLKWAVAAGLAFVLAGGTHLWRVHAQNTMHYETVPVERGAIQAKVTATDTLNAVVDVVVSSQVSGK